jgi:hypothetical protein
VTECRGPQIAIDAFILRLSRSLPGPFFLQLLQKITQASLGTELAFEVLVAFTRLAVMWELIERLIDWLIDWFIY